MKQINPQRWFPIVVEKDEDGFFVAVNPSLTGCYSQGKTIEEALVNVQEATELCLEGTSEKEVNRDTQVSVHLIAA
jgi:predicted RNase H-like HicB family nuclease